MAKEAIEKFRERRRISGGVYKENPDTVSDGEPVSLLTDNAGRLDLACVPFNPPSGGGQAVAFSAIAGRSTQLTVGARYWIWATESCWISMGDSSITATSSDFPLPPGAVTEYTPTTDRDYVSVVQISQTGSVYIGRAA